LTTTGDYVANWWTKKNDTNDSEPKIKNDESKNNTEDNVKEQGKE